MKIHHIAIFVIMVLLGVASVFVYKSKVEFDVPTKAAPTKTSQKVVEDKSYSIKYIRVLAGNEFDLKLENGNRIHIRLKVSTVPEAKEKVIAYLNKQATKPKVVVYGKDGDVMIADIYVVENSKETSLTQWLKDNGLVWD